MPGFLAFPLARSTTNADTLAAMPARYVPHTITGGRLFPSDHQPQPEEKVRTMEELDAAIRASVRREGSVREGSVTVWILEELRHEILSP